MTALSNLAPRDSAMSQTDFDYVAALVKKHAAIELGPDKQYLVEQRLSSVIREQDLPSISELIGRTRRDATGRTTMLVVDAMTTNETSFFRDPTVYEFLRAEILPELVARNRSTRQLRIWCGASSSGQEPYSILMLLREHFPELASWNIQLLATDISPTMLERTRKGRYGRIEVNRGLPAPLLVKYFTREGLEWVVSEPLRNSVQTREINLSKPFPISDKFDLVLVRNVLIYFSLETKRAVLDRVRKVLVPGGYLFLGSTESTIHIDDSWSRRTYGNVSCYQPLGARSEEAPR
jgi:chemotaxis protein methyltransferase CheR